MRTSVEIEAAFDDETQVWYVLSSDLFGVHAQAETFDALVAKLPPVIEDMVEANNVVAAPQLDLRVVARSNTRMNLAA
jgi:predicted RNase H-like HicB family nuclease